MTPIDEPGFEAPEVWNGVLRDQREVTLQGSGIVVTHRVTATGALPVEFLIVDPLPGEFDIEDLGFHPDFEPAHGYITPEQAVIAGVAAPEEELAVRYGLTLHHRHRPADIDERQRTTDPSIELSTQVEAPDPADGDLESAAMTRSADAATAESAAAFSDLSRRLEAKEAAVWGPDVPGDAGWNGDSAVPTAHTETVAEAADPSGPRTDDPPAVDDRFEQDPDARFEDPRDRPTHRRRRRGEPFGDSARDASLAPSNAPSEDEASDADAPEAANASGPATADDAAVVQALIDDLQTERVTAEQRRRLGEQLGRLFQDADRGHRSTDVRLRHLESQLQRFESYADALEAVTDVHGPAEEFLAGVRDGITAVESKLGDLEHGFEAASAARRAQRKRLNEQADEIARLDSRLERLHDGLDSLRSHHRRRPAELDGRLTAVEPAVGRVDDLETDVADLQESMERIETRLEAAGDALTSRESD